MKKGRKMHQLSEEKKKSKKPVKKDEVDMHGGTEKRE